MLVVISKLQMLTDWVAVTQKNVEYWRKKYTCVEACMRYKEEVVVVMVVDKHTEKWWGQYLLL